MALNKHEIKAVELFNQLKFNDALKESKLALSLNKKTQVGQLIKGLALLNLKQYQKAAEELKIATSNQFQQEVAFKNLAKAYHALGRYKECENALIKALERRPKWIECLFDLAHLKQITGELINSENIYKEIITIEPNNLGALNNLAVLLRAQKKFEEALDLLRKIIEFDSKYLNAVINIGGVLNSLNRPVEALKYLSNCLELEPKNFYLMVNAADAYRMLGKFSEALKLYTHAIEIKPDESCAYNGLGQLYSAINQNQQALKIYKKAIDMGMNDPAIYNNLGALYVELGVLDAAEESYLRAINLNGQFTECYSNLGILYTKQGRYVQAFEAYDKSIEFNSKFIAAYNNKANLLGVLGRHHESIKIFKKIIDEGGANERTYINLASAFYNVGEIDSSIKCSKKAIELGSRESQAFNNLGLAQKDWCLFDDAIKNFETALSIDSSAESVYDNLLFTVNYHPDLSAEEIYKYYKRYGQQFDDEKISNNFQNRKKLNKKIRLGYVSPDFKRHACAKFIMAFLDNYDHECFELYAYAENILEDDCTEEFKRIVPNWRRTHNMNDIELDQQIRDDQIDILVDLAGHTKGNRLKVFAKRPAPVSATYLGFGYTTGLKAIDYFLACEYSVPTESENLFSENVWRLPYLGCYANTEGIPNVSDLPAIKNKYVTFCSLSRSIRINDAVIAAWSNILKKLPNSKLIVNSSDYADKVSRARLIEKFYNNGIDSVRLKVGFESPPWSTLHNSDISLDCFPHNSGTTLYESLYMGVPFVTLADRPPVGRWGGGVLKTAGYPEWISNSVSEYIAKAVDLGSNYAELSKIRNELREKVSKTSLFNQKKFLREVELEYKKMWKLYCNKVE